MGQAVADCQSCLPHADDDGIYLEFLHITSPNKSAYQDFRCSHKIYTHRKEKFRIIITRYARILCTRDSVIAFSYIRSASIFKCDQLEYGASGTSMKSILIRYPLASFFAVTIGLSWLVWIPAAWRVGETLRFYYLLGLLAPAAAAILVRWAGRGWPGVKEPARRTLVVARAPAVVRAGILRTGRGCRACPGDRLPLRRSKRRTWLDWQPASKFRRSRRLRSCCCCPSCIWSAS